MLEKILIGFAVFVMGAYTLTDKNIEENFYAHSPHKQDTVLLNFSFDYVTFNHNDSAILYTTIKRPYKEAGYRVYELHDYYVLKSDEIVTIMDKHNNKMLNYYIAYR